MGSRAVGGIHIGKFDSSQPWRALGARIIKGVHLWAEVYENVDPTVLRLRGLMTSCVQRMSLLVGLLLSSGALAADEPTIIEVDGSSGMHFPTEEKSCGVAQSDALSNGTEACLESNGAVVESKVTDCSCEQGGFEDKEWLCRASATLSCAPQVAVEVDAVGMSERLSFDLPTSISNTELLKREFRRRGMTFPTTLLDERFGSACVGGWKLACERDTWRTTTGASLNKAAKLLQGECERGDQTACLAYGWALEEGGETQQSDSLFRASARKFKYLCDSKRDQTGCYEYGTILFNNLGVKADPRLGIRRWAGACSGGEAAACTVLAKVYRKGIKTRENIKKAMFYAEKACSMGDALGCIELAHLDEDPLAPDRARVKACQRGSVGECWSLASAYLSGERNEPMRGLTRNLLDLGCELGDGPSCGTAAKLALHDGDATVAARLYRRACDVGEVPGCIGIVDLILSGRAEGGVKEDHYGYEVACSKGKMPQACTELGLALLYDEANPDSIRARSLLKQSCVDKNSPAEPCFVLGELYETGKGGSRDRTLAARYYKWACNQGWGEACERRGDLLHHGVGVRLDDEGAVAMYQKGCDQGNTNTCYKAGVILDEGTVIERDAERALKLFKLSCDKNHADGCLRLGNLYLEGVGGERDEKAARAAFDRAVSLGQVEAHRRLAWMLWNGVGGRRQRSRAKDLCKAGCQADDQIACHGPSFQTEQN